MEVHEHRVEWVLDHARVRPDAPAAISVRSSSTTRRPVSASFAAHDTPTMPAPMTMTSGARSLDLGGSSVIAADDGRPADPHGDAGHRNAPTEVGAFVARRRRAGESIERTGPPSRSRAGA
jgi:hypothetical protein